MNIKEIQLEDKDRYGALLSPDIKIARKYFEEMVKLLGIQVMYYAPRKDKEYTIHGEIKSNYREPIQVGCLFDSHPDQKSLKKMGWVAELQEESSLISVPYDLPDVQVGALFAIPSGLDRTKGRLFRVVSLSNIMIYPSSITCEIVPEWEDTLPEEKMDRRYQDFNLLKQEDDGVF